MKERPMYLKHLSRDLPASLVVFLVALPLCLGIAVASEASPIAGILSGVIGGMVVGFLSGSQLSVSGPAAGLTAVVAAAITNLPSYEVFLLSVVLAGGIQLVLGLVRAGIVGYFFPGSVIKGMLAAIGLILILKEIPHALGWDADYLGNQTFRQSDDYNTFSAIFAALSNIKPGAVALSAFSLLLIYLFDHPAMKRLPLVRYIPGTLMAVAGGLLLNLGFTQRLPGWAMSGENLVALPDINSFGDLSAALLHPDFSAIGMPEVWGTALVIALIASIESLLSIEATDKLDPLHRDTPTNRELRAQGIGNIAAGMVGGIPVTAVIVRSSANIAAGGRTKVSAIVHGLLLAVLVVAIPGLLNLIPFASLAAVLFVVGFKLTKPKLFTEMYRKGWSSFLPFSVTVVAILCTDLLIGIGIGLFVGFYFVIKSNYRRSIVFAEHKNNYLIKLNRNVTYLNRAVLSEYLQRVPSDSELLIDVSRTEFIDPDIRETLEEFIQFAPMRNITVSFNGAFLNPSNQ